MFSSKNSAPKFKRRGLATVGGLLAAGLALTACGSGSSGSDEKLDNGDKKEISIGVPSGWEEGTAVSAMWQQILEDEGYDVKSETADIGVVFTSLSKDSDDSYDVLFDAWLPQTHKKYVDKYKDKVSDLGTWYTGATLNIAVNEDSKAQSIGDLKKMGKDYGDKLVGIEPGAGLTDAAKKAIKDYKLDNLNFTTSSTQAMLTELKKAEKDGSDVAVTLWHPHWAYSKFKIRDLKDPKGSMGKGEELHAYGSKKFEDDYPTASKLFKNFKLDDDQLAALENETTDAKDVQKAAKKWLDDNPDFVKDLKSEAGVED